MIKMVHSGVLGGRQLNLAGMPLCFISTTNENEAASTEISFFFFFFHGAEREVFPGRFQVPTTTGEMCPDGVRQSRSTLYTDNATRHKRAREPYLCS